ncbi:MAG: hypothetical protein NXH88_04600 [Hyphomonas sp.]|nr:hypothetical protein [Hyphomonas sp.]
MTLQNGMTDAHKAYLWADTGYWDMNTGELIGHDTKLFHGKDWPWAGALTTWGASARDLIADISFGNVTDLDNLLTTSGKALRTFVANGGGGRVAIASYDGKPRLHMIACHDLFPGSGYGPFEPVEVGHFVCSGNESPAYQHARANGFTPEGMRAVIDAQCVTPWVPQGDLAALGPRVWMAGNVVRVEVGADGVTSAVERAV